MFLTFKTNEERRAYGGSAFVELSYCRQKKDASLRKIFRLKNLPNWQADSLYVRDDELNAFADAYRVLLGETVYSGGGHGLYEECGVNYFSPEAVKGIIERVGAAKPAEYEILLPWLEAAKELNGFYLLGI